MHQRIQRLDRRTVLKTSTALFASGIGLAAYSQRSRAEVTTNSLSLPDKTLSDTDGEIISPYLRIDGSWEYDIADTPNSWEVLLALVNGDGSRAVIDQAGGTLSATADTGTYTLEGNVTEADFYSTADFTVSEAGASKDITLDVLVLFYVRNGDAILAKDNIGAQPTIRVHHAKEPALIGGTGEIGAQYDAGETPTYG